MATTKIPLALQSSLNITNNELSTVSDDVTVLQNTLNTPSTGVIDRVVELENQIDALNNTKTPNITISGVYDVNTTMATAGATDGFYIWTELPSDKATYLSSGTINDIWECDGGVWSTYLTYSNSSTSYTVSGVGNYIKSSDDSWIISSAGVALTPLDIYPIGAIYISTVGTNPSSYFGGTWSAFAAGRVLVGVGTLTDGVGNTRSWASGTEIGTYKHELDAKEMVPHKHKMNADYGGDITSASSGDKVLYNSDGSGSPYQDTEWFGGPQQPDDGDGDLDLDSYGSSHVYRKAVQHENTQPSIGVYIWQRTA